MDDNLITTLFELLTSQNIMLVTAESCTGGMIAAAITERAGSSAVFERGYVTYSNAAKIELLDVPKEIIDTQGAVSAECAQAMATGALKNSHGNIALSVTGIAGPGGGSADKPVGLVHFAVAHQIAHKKDGAVNTQSYHHLFERSRHDIRRAALRFGLERVIETLRDMAA